MELKQVTLLFKKQEKGLTGTPVNSFESVISTATLYSKENSYNNDKSHFAITSEIKIKLHKELLKYKILEKIINCNLFIMDGNWYQIDRTSEYDRLTTFVFATEIDGGIYNETEIN